MLDSPLSRAQAEEVIDPLTLGRRIRTLRTDAGLTLAEVAEAIGTATSHLSVLENGKREAKLSELQAIARVLGSSLEQLVSAAPLSGRAALEVELERVQGGPLFSALGIPPLPVRKSLSDEAIRTVLALHAELQRVHSERAATPEEARRANTELRRAMRARGNYFGELEQTAAGLLRAVGHEGGPLSQRLAAELAAHLGFTLHYVGDLPGSTRSVTDLEHGRIYLPVQTAPGRDPRSVLLQALAGHVLGRPEPRDYTDFLQQRVETNYLAAALLIPEADAVAFLQRAKQRRELAVEDLRDAFAVSYETAAHRFTNLATEHLEIPVHFLKVSAQGVLSKAYENDSVQFPTDALGAVEGQLVCRQWSARQVFDEPDRFSPYHQYTDKPTGTYWCTSRIESGTGGDFSISVGTPFAHVKWFRGRETTRRGASTCPDPGCCRRAPDALAAKWQGRARPQARIHASLLATLPTESFPGVDQTEVLGFLERHAPTGGAA
ncbi:helix-turn-helix transcriptional regulator [Microcella frigidaquae]|uniref:Putative transcriptional regulator/transcriptional regulator with XRE-family HTH domain n=1 Tax=Microcella frigidaquae TaxID=424758 RepID=A0A840X6P9_9MICO|nr:helix-turn-helix transcriptional regulator [Microcella frigidaquae]MBB5617911.1 putative transcriptional regulator/transcriptional regulator with XRE-family HTH domain [Microcella frigidaquae]NHN44375.1 helix-turn-helix domain-containing protein [Microcella frigidaquae]